MFHPKPNLSFAVSFTLFIIMGLCISDSSAAAQVEDGSRERTDPVAQDRSVNRPPPPDDPSERDVAKRLRFIWALGAKTRLSWGFFPPGYLKEAGKDILADHKQAFLRGASMLLAEPLNPHDMEQIKWYGNWAHDSLPDSKGNVGLTLRLIVAEWSVDGYTVLVSQIKDSHYLRFRIRFPQRIDVRFRAIPENFSGDSSQWEFVSKAAVRKLLLELCDWPVDSKDDFRLAGQHLLSCAGVDVYQASIQSWPRKQGALQEEGDGSITSAAVPDRILITDSDPQYVCVSFDLRPKDQ